MNRRIQTNFETQSHRLAFLAQKAPWLTPQPGPSLRPGDMDAQLERVNPSLYAIDRNYIEGSVSRLSAFIRHGMVPVAALDNTSANCDPDQAEKWNQELAWRSFWHHVLARHPEWAWTDAEPIKTGWPSTAYADILPDDIQTAQTGVACLDFWINQLIRTGYIHNHARAVLGGIRGSLASNQMAMRGGMVFIRVDRRRRCKQ